MPVLNKEKQRQCVGETAFCNTSGDFLRDLGSCDNIRITESKVKPEEITKILRHIAREDIGTKFSEGIDSPTDPYTMP